MNKLNSILENDAIKVNSKVRLDAILGKHIIITGASGLIGINFLISIREFCKNKRGKQQPKITAIFHNKIPSHFKDILNFKNLMVITGDITDPALIKSLDPADYIIHAAGYAQPGRFMQDKIKTIAINTTATMSLLNKLKNGGSFLFISTSEIYSGLPNPPYKESQIGNTNTTHPRSCYIESKRCGEAICHAYYEMGKMVKTARLSLAYGPGTRPRDMRVLNSFIEKGLAGKIEMMDKGESKRTYCYISDAIEIMWNILLSGKKPIYNVGGKSRTTIRKLADRIGTLLRIPVSSPDHDDHKLKGTPDDVFLNMTAVKNEFNKTNYVPISTGLRNTIEWQKELSKEINKKI